MALITWNNSLSVKVAEIDQQHQKLITLINGLNDVMIEGRANDVGLKVVQDLMTYTAFHFTTEEKYFDKLGYPDAEAHKKEHSDFVNKVMKFKQGYEEGGIGLTTKIMNFLRDWLKQHIMGTDQKYAQFFNEKGLK